MIFDVIASHWKAVFYDSGREIVNDMVGTLSAHGVDPQEFKAVLDFGCGCGRLIRHFHGHTDARLYGSDYNPELVGWCDANLPIASFSTNELSPPLRYDDASFDFVYARSVFTHLPEALMEAWIAEMSRVIRPSGTLYFTMHGRPMIGGLSPAEQQAFDRNEFVVTYSTFAGENLCSTYGSRAFVDRVLSDRFERIAFVEGCPSPNLRQDVHLMRRR